MPFRSGSVSYARLRVSSGPTEVTTALLEMLAEHTMRPPSVGAPPELQHGWVAGRHVYDDQFDPEVVAFGDTLLFGMREDVCRVPGEVRRAYRAMAEQARSAASPTGFLNRSEKRDAKEEADDRCREELAAGQHRRSKVIPVLWNVREKIVLAPVFSDAAMTGLRDLFEGTFSARLTPLTAGAMAREILADGGRASAYDELLPTPFTPPPPLAEAGMGDRPLVPWAGGFSDHPDWIGNEFLLWLWMRLQAADSTFGTPIGEVAVALQNSLDLDCGWEVGGKIGLRADGPTQMPEAKAALRAGKCLLRCALILSVGGETFTLTMQGDRFLASGLKLPRPEEMPASDREHVELRLGQVEMLDRAMMSVFRLFLDDRVGSRWAEITTAVQRWLRDEPKKETPAPKAPVEIEVLPAAEAAVGQST